MPITPVTPRITAAQIADTQRVYYASSALNLLAIADGAAYATAGGTLVSLSSGGPKVVSATDENEVEEACVVTARNTIADLIATPVGSATFEVNGVGVANGAIFNTGRVVTVNPAVLAYNIDPVDTVVARFKV